MCNMRTLIVASILLTSTPAIACIFDTDCGPGSKCLKGDGPYGVCADGIAPGNSNDQTPAQEQPPDLNGTTGETCNFDPDCGLGSKCLKSSGSVSGVCMGR
jgi:hypothetical protein